MITLTIKLSRNLDKSVVGVIYLVILKECHKIVNYFKNFTTYSANQGNTPIDNNSSVLTRVLCQQLINFLTTKIAIENNPKNIVINIIGNDIPFSFHKCLSS